MPVLRLDRLGLARVCVALAWLGGCGSEGARVAPPPPAAPVVLVAVVVTPGATSVPAGLQQQFIATGTYSDGASRDVTTSAAWSSSNASVARMDEQASGKALAGASGTATIAATLLGIHGDTQLVVTPAAIASLRVAIHPAFFSPRHEGTWLASGMARPLVAIASYTDGTQQDATAAASWTSSRPQVVLVSDTKDAKGVVAGVAAGSATVEAASGSVKGTIDLTVLPAMTLDGWIPGQLAPALGEGAMDDEGDALVTWCYSFTGGNFASPPVLATASYLRDGGWKPATPVDFGSIDDSPATPRLAVNASGAALLAWVGHSGIYASEYVPGNGWQAARTLASGSSPFLVFGRRLQVAIDSAGNGLAVWANDNGDQVLSSRYDAATDSWSAAQDLPGVNRGAANSMLSLAMNAGGSAVLLWESWTTSWVVHASRFVAGTGDGAGWQTPESLYQSQSWTTPAVAINGAGQIVATWVEYVADFPRSTVFAARFLPDQGWQSVQTLLATDMGQAADPVLAMNDAGEAVVVWRRRADAGVRASRCDTAGAWQAPEALWVPHYVDGDPTVLRPQIAPDGRMLAAWTLEEMGAPKVAVSRYVPGAGWTPAEGLPEIEHFGKLAGLAISSDSSGRTLVVWGETYDVWDGQAWNTFVDYYADPGLTY